MSYIDPDGMFGGDRMAMLTDRARFFWPWIWVASNTVGRIELNHRKISDTVFRQFTHRPTEEQFWQLIKEFNDCYLLFVYQDRGHIWGQWNVSEKYLPQYKIKADLATPAPNAAELVKWQDLYAKQKAASMLSKCPIANLSESFQNIPSRACVDGEERRDGDVGKENPSCADRPRRRRAPAGALNGSVSSSEFEHWLDGAHDRWIDNAYWRRVGRKDSRAAFGKRVKQLMGTGKSKEESVEFLIQMAIEDRKRFEPTDDWAWRKNLHPATWLNGERWNDEAGSAASNGKGRRPILLAAKPPEPTQQELIEAFRYQAEHDSDPTARQYAEKELKEKYGV